MLLVFGSRALDQRPEVKPLGLGEDRRGNLDGVIAGEDT
jgi:hypothetical protein